ncbi:MAG: DUF697 domain-containing protein [Myxococcales bacterium]|nr:DUF697 domain-containing protein [Myxococcales bacterium]
MSDAMDQPPTDAATATAGDTATKVAAGPRADQAEGIIQRHVVAAIAVGVVPVPFIDLAALVGVQLNMLRAIGELYDQPIVEQLGRSLIVSLVGGLVPLSSASLLKAIPVVGQLIGGISAPVLTGASTYATGRVFVVHFESGGTLLSLDPEQLRAHYRREFERAQAIVREQTARDLRP